MIPPWVRRDIGRSGKNYPIWFRYIERLVAPSFQVNTEFHFRYNNRNPRESRQNRFRGAVGINIDSTGGVPDDPPVSDSILIISMILAVEICAD
jgi:hypothetical protein